MKTEFHPHWPIDGSVAHIGNRAQVERIRDGERFQITGADAELREWYAKSFLNTKCICGPFNKPRKHCPIHPARKVQL